MLVFSWRIMYKFDIYRLIAPRFRALVPYKHVKTPLVGWNSIQAVSGPTIWQQWCVCAWWKNVTMDNLSAVLFILDSTSITNRRTLNDNSATCRMVTNKCVSRRFPDTRAFTCRTVTITLRAAKNSLIVSG